MQNRFEKWLHILKFGDYYRSDSELPGELKKEKGICEVIKQMSTANTDEQMRYELLAREMFLSDLATDLDAAERNKLCEPVAAYKTTRKPKCPPAHPKK